MLRESIREDLKAAMKAGDKTKVSCLRMLIAAVKNREVALKQELSDPELLAVIRSQLKQVQDSLEQFKKGNREDLVQLNAAILEAYLPRQLEDSEIETLVDEVISEIQATRKDFGTVMKLVVQRVAGRADGKKVNSIVAGRLR